MIFKDLLLCLIALILTTIIAPISFIYAVLKLIFSFKFKELFSYFHKILYGFYISIDKFGNVVCQYLFNDVLIKKDDMPFGLDDETISSVIGKNKVKHNLTKEGVELDEVLDKTLGQNHSINSIKDK